MSESFCEPRCGPAARREIFLVKVDTTVKSCRQISYSGQHVLPSRALKPRGKDPSNLSHRFLIHSGIIRSALEKVESMLKKARVNLG